MAAGLCVRVWQKWLLAVAYGRNICLRSRAVGMVARVRLVERVEYRYYSAKKW